MPYFDERQSIVSRSKTVTLKTLYSIVIALLPVMMIYNVPVLEMGISTVLLGVFAPYALHRFHAVKNGVHIWPFIILIVYMIIRSAGSFFDQFLMIIVLIHVFGAIQGRMDFRLMRKTMEIVAVVATACVIFQTVVYYLFGIRATLLIPQLMMQEHQSYFTSTFGKLYRPSAFFLEPSHYTQYCSLAMLSVLFPFGNKKANLKKAIWIALGSVLTTSGIGIVLCIGVLGWYVLFTKRKQGTKIKTILGWCIIAVIAFAVLMQFSFFAQAVQRIFGEVDGYNAIWGRTLYWDSYIGSLKGIQAFLGKGVLNIPEGYMTGLMTIIYSYGYLGVALTLVVFIYLFCKGKGNYSRCVCVIYCGLSCIADLTSFLSYVFWFGVVITAANYEMKEQRRIMR